MGEVVNIDTPSWSPEQVARELVRRVEQGDIKAVVVALELDPKQNDGWCFDWIGSKQSYNERVYLIEWFYRRTMARIFGGT